MQNIHMAQGPHPRSVFHGSGWCGDVSLAVRWDRRGKSHQLQTFKLLGGAWSSGKVGCHADRKHGENTVLGRDKSVGESTCSVDTGPEFNSSASMTLHWHKSRIIASEMKLRTHAPIATGF